MTPRFELTAEADADLDAIAWTIARDNLRAAHRLYDAAWDTFESLARTPGLGRRRVIDNPNLKACDAPASTAFGRTWSSISRPDSECGSSA